ncbi:hypothetical protein M2440_000685 [Methylorubrum extorquens]|nr:hypothetical protein [Methylorubrum extorquens]
MRAALGQILPDRPEGEAAGRHLALGEQRLVGLVTVEGEDVLGKDVAGVEALLGEHVGGDAPVLVAIENRLEERIGAPSRRQRRGVEVQGIAHAPVPAPHEPGITGDDEDHVAAVLVREPLDVVGQHSRELDRDAVAPGLGHHELVVIVDAVAGPGEQLHRRPAGFDQPVEHAAEEVDAGKGEFHGQRRPVAGRPATFGARRGGFDRLHADRLRLS